MSLFLLLAWFAMGYLVRDLIELDRRQKAAEQRLGELLDECVNEGRVLLDDDLDAGIDHPLPKERSA